jgi:hypothetical protein
VTSVNGYNYFSATLRQVDEGAIGKKQFAF